MEIPPLRPISLLMLLLLFITAVGCGPREPAPDVEELTEARFGIVDSEWPPADAELVETVLLPDYWNRERPGVSGIGWYRLRFSVPADRAEPWAVYVPSSSSSIKLFLADEQLGPTGIGPDDNLQNWDRPVYFELPEPLIAQNPDAIYVRLWAREGSFRGLGSVEIGPARSLEPRYRAAHFWQVDIFEIWLALGITQVIFALGLWVATDRDPIYACFTWLVVAWLAPAVVQSLPRFPGNFWLGQWLIHVGIYQMAIAAIFVGHRAVGVSRPGLERLIVGIGVLAAASLGLAAGFAVQLFDPVAIAFHTIALNAIIYLPILFFMRREGLNRTERILLTGALVAMLLAGIHDLMAQTGLKDETNARFVLHVLPLLLLLFFLVVVQRFLETYRRANRQNLELETRIAAKTRELEAHYRQLDELQRERVLEGERSRMTREMHDGMGAQLVSLLSVVERDELDRESLASALREAIDELRLVIHSLDPDGREVGALLGLMRERFAPRIKQSGLRLEWRVEVVEGEPELSPEASLHLVRIVQEAITNVVKHSHATSMTISMERWNRAGESGLMIRITDDGVGPDASHGGRASESRGLRNMHERAGAIGGEVRITGSNAGTQVELWLPCELAPRPFST